MKLLFLVVFLATCHAFTQSYEGHQVLRFYPETLDQLQGLKVIEQQYRASEFDFWKAPSAIGRAVDIRVSPGSRSSLLDFTDLLRLNHTVFIEDLQAHFLLAREKAGTDWDQAYHNLDDINSWMDGLVKQYPAFVSSIKVGLTYQGRTIYGLKITKSTKNTTQLFFDGGIHAREWMAPAVVQYVIGQLVNNQSLYDSYLQNFEWYFVPVLNADGYVYTWNTDPNWRKNRQPNEGNCIGTDPARNADAGFGGEGSSSNFCSDTYRGAYAWSAPMMAALRDYLAAMPRLKSYVNFHSYAESWLTPYGYTAKRPADFQTQEQNAKNATEAIKQVNGKQYQYGPAYITIYPASGVPSDWVYDSLKVKLSQAVELRGASFQPPASFILPIGQEMMAGVLTLADDVVFVG